MKITKTILLGIGLAGFLASGARAQQGLSAAGSDIYGPGGSVSFTIGQADYVTTNGTGGTMTQGIQQPIEILILTGIEQTSIQLKCAVYPNPTADYVILDMKQSVSDQMEYVLCNADGRMIRVQKIYDNQTKISLSELSNSIYFIKVINNSKEVKTFKIIKNK